LIVLAGGCDTKYYRQGSVEIRRLPPLIHVKTRGKPAPLPGNPSMVWSNGSSLFRRVCDIAGDLSRFGDIPVIACYNMFTPATCRRATMAIFTMIDVVVG
jgi:hypothetical protein